MGKFRKFMSKAVTAAVAAAMMIQGAALAAPVDELNEIFEKQNEAGSQSVMEETLGLSELGKAIAESGLNCQMKAALTEGTAAALGIDDEIPADGYVNVGFQLDLAQAAWALTAGAGSGEASVLDMILYGDRKQLALTIPQFFSGAVALGAGNFKEQYENSALAEMLGGAESVPDMDLSFYPEEDRSGETDGPFAEIQEQIEEKAAALSSDMQVEKTEDGDTVVYTAAIETADIMEFYSIIFKGYISVCDELGLLTGVSTGDMSDIESEIDEMISQMGAVLGDEISMDFVTKNGLLEEIRYELYCDTTVFNDIEETMTEIVEDELAPAGNAEDAAAENQAVLDTAELAEEIAEAQTSAGESGDASTAVIGGADSPVEISVESEDFQGYISYDIVYYDPEDLGKGFFMNMVVKDVEGAEAATFYMDWNRTEDGTAEKYSCTMDMTENGETIYSGTLFTAGFDSATGDFDVTFTVQDDEGNNVAANLDSTFTQIEKGRSFVWKIDSLNLESAGEKVGVNAEIQISADPGELPAPENVKDILKLTDIELSSLLQEIQLNVLKWGAQFAPETETEVEAETGFESAL